MDTVDSVFYSDHMGPSSNPLLDQLPSYQSLLYRRKPSATAGTKRRASSRTRVGSSSSWKWKVDRVDERPKVACPQRPVRELPKTMEEKRRDKEQRMEQARDLSSWEQWRQNARRSLRRLKEESLDLLSTLELWRGDIHVIEGMFGTGILSYFSFLRFLVLLNFVIFLLMFSFVMLPIIVAPHAGGNSTFNARDGGECSIYPSTSRRGLVVFHQYIADLLSGTGFLEGTYLFYGFYKVQAINYPRFTYNLPLAYVLVTIAYLFLSLIWIVKRSASGFKRKLVQDEDRFQSFCNKIFAGWDFCITNENAARLKRSSLLYELKTDLEEERTKQKIADRTRKDKCRIYVLRVVLNVFVIAVLATCFYSIYRATIFSQESQMRPTGNVILDLIYEYLPSIVITLANFITPLMFTMIIQYEDYSPAFEIRFTLMRCVFMRLASIGVLLFSLWSQITFCPGNNCSCGYNHKRYPCWESHVGQEMYKLMIFDFIIIGAVTVFVEFPRKLIVTYCDCGLAKCTIKYFIVFYIKKMTLMNNCRPATRPFRASSSNFFFLAVLLIGLALACVPVIVSIAEISCSQACGPFVNYTTSWEVVPQAVSQLPSGLSTFLFALASEPFAVTFFVITCLVMFYFIALAAAHKRVVDHLREQLVMEGKDKRFLIQKLLQAQRTSVRSPGGHSRSDRGSQSHSAAQNCSSTGGVYLVQPPVSATHV
ncbi:hypothetical protein AGOR_G00090930 [Albula goreensis]|uniref:Transmembrane channel-like protein n=1 Tax=Albula goreensis TaxID=1534307 RepID=A0A8T3DI16_9TELE|nr:hypothetical protein AGOR_G00090930 [Albula goreensis]